MKRLSVLIGSICLILVFVALPFMGACAPAPAQAVKLRLATGLAVTHHLCAEAIPAFKNEVEQKTNGRIAVELYLAGELYKHGDMASVIPSGAIEMSVCHQGHLGTLNPLMNMGGLYFTIPNIDTWLEAGKDVNAILAPILEESNVKFLADMHYGGAAIGNSKREVLKPEDAKGLKLRGPTAAHQACITAWGGTPASLAISEVYDAVKKGAVDGTVTGWSTFYSRKWYEVANYFSGTTHWSMWLMIMNLDAFNRLSKDDQKIVLEAAKKASEISLETGLKYDQESIAALKAVGGNVHIFSPDEQKLWQQATMPAYFKWKEECAKAGYEAECLKIAKALGLDLE